MNGEKISDRERFEEVWSRVMEENASQSAAQRAESDSADLRMLMDDVSCAAGAYAALRKRVSGKAAEMLGVLQAEERSHMQSLRTAYFLKTGKAYSPPGSCPVVSSVTGALRLWYAREVEMSAKCIACASKTADTALSGLYRNISADEVRHAQTIMRLCGMLVGGK